MCSIFSVCSERVSVIMMSMISCNLLLASLGAVQTNLRQKPYTLFTHHTQNCTLTTQYDERRNVDEIDFGKTRLRASSI